MTREGFLFLSRVEERLEDLIHDASKAMVFGGDDGTDWYWYSDGQELITELLDNEPLIYVERMPA